MRTCLTILLFLLTCSGIMAQEAYSSCFQYLLKEVKLHHTVSLHEDSIPYDVYLIGIENYARLDTEPRSDSNGITRDFSWRVEGQKSFLAFEADSAIEMEYGNYHTSQKGLAMLWAVYDSAAKRYYFTGYTDSIMHQGIEFGCMNNFGFNMHDVLLDHLDAGMRGDILEFRYRCTLSGDREVDDYLRFIYQNGKLRFLSDSADWPSADAYAEAVRLLSKDSVPEAMIVLDNMFMPDFRANANQFSIGVDFLPKVYESCKRLEKRKKSEQAAANIDAFINALCCQRLMYAYTDFRDSSYRPPAYANDGSLSRDSCAMMFDYLAVCCLHALQPYAAYPIDTFVVNYVQDRPDAWLHIGDARYDMNEPAEAAAAYNKYISLKRSRKEKAIEPRALKRAGF